MFLFHFIQYQLNLLILKYHRKRDAHVLACERFGSINLNSMAFISRAVFFCGVVSQMLFYLNRYFFNLMFDWWCSVYFPWVVFSRKTI